jgi:DNA polymerase-1
MQKLFLLDAYALIYRAYYALIRSPRINSKGENTSAIFGFVNTLEDLLAKQAPDYIAVAFDPHGPTFRHEAYADYKAQREATPEDIRRAVPIIKEILRAYGIPQLEVPGYEADDVIGTMARRGAAAGLDVRMVTPDKDYAQLVAPGITMCRPGHGAGAMEELGVKEVCEKYQLTSPQQVIDLLALMGDAADNIPGCPGVGEKTAQKLLAQFGSIEEMLARTAEIKGALRKKVEEHAEEIRFSRFLTTIKTDVPLDIAPEDLRRQEGDREALRKLFEELEFRSFIKKLFPDEKVSTFTPSTAAEGPVMGSLFDEMTDEEAGAPKKSILAGLQQTPHKYHFVETVEDALRIRDKILTHEKVGFSTQATGVDALTAELVGMSFSPAEGEAYFVAVPRETSAAREMVAVFQPFFENTSLLKVGQNIKYHLNVLTRYGARPVPPFFDTMLAHYVVQPEMRHNRDELAEAYLHYRPLLLEGLIGPKGKGQRQMGDLAAADLCDYACEEADVTRRLMAPLESEMQRLGVARVFYDIEMPLMPVLAQMERHGVCLDTEALTQTGRDFKARMAQLESDIYQLAGHSFSITSPRQVGTVLFDELKLDERARKTKSGQYSTGEEVLEKLRPRHPIVGKILAHRALKKLIGTYIDALPLLINPTTGHIHTSFNQAVTATGRLSSSSPNLQNIPVRGEDGREIRKAFIPEEGCTFFSADYSQIELRIMACLSGDPHMIQDFCDGRDIHAATAARIYKKALDDVTRDERRKAKTANFGIIYGISAFGLAERMEVSRGEAKELIDSYFATYPRVKAYMEECIAQARERGYIETQFGRRRYLPDITSHNAVVRGYAERNAINAPIQGTAADIIKVAMIRIARRIEEEGLHAKMILQVHDELNFSVPTDELDRLQHLVTEEMEQAWQARVPLLADCGSGANWLEAH